uniref:SREBP regulating gene protein n=1 Tax=Alexandrium catenella TaxID=2925 RepID=A0A7S1RKU1_ALECA|mmetsp:Transcript_62892/g.167974  ORF Transcript_62892/g.167974 Transcript_62892/m.167974 type:complete len:147 (+) Transcript_62892:72-512(+)
MQSTMAILALGLLAAASGARVRARQTPDEVKLGMEYRDKDSFGSTALTPACSKIQCGAYSCPSPFELKVDGTCCGYCWAPDHAVAADRHVVVEYNASGHAVEQCEGAPSTCKGPGVNTVRCFRPSCRAGDAPHCSPGSCCPICTTR